MITILLAVAAILGAGAAITAVATARIVRTHPPLGRMVPVTGARIHVLELGSPRDTERWPVVMLHGASSNLVDLRFALGDRLAETGRVVLLDRPGLGWSERPAGENSPAHQAALIAEALERIGVDRFVLVGHSYGGTVAAAFASAYQDRLAGLVLIAPVTHPWVGGLDWYIPLLATPVLGPLFARTIAFPLAQLLQHSGAASVFAPQPVPADYFENAAIALLFRPAQFFANAQDIAGLKAFVTAAAPTYKDITVPTVVITGDADTVVSPTLHAETVAAVIPQARLVVLEGVGHMPHYALPDAIVEAINSLSLRAPADSS
jgi:pimeloyl-ACP methyl ester carboxylesterase